MSYEEEALAEIEQIRQRMALLERMAADPAATPDSLRGEDLVAAAEQARFRNPELVARLLAGEDGDPADLVAGLASEYPYLLQPTMNELLRAGRRGRPGPGS